MIIVSNALWDRIVQVMYYCGETKILAFGRRIGLEKPEKLYRIRRSGNCYGAWLAESITGSLPEINRDWLLHGRGGMLCGPSPRRPERQAGAVLKDK